MPSSITHGVIRRASAATHITFQHHNKYESFNTDAELAVVAASCPNLQAIRASGRFTNEGFASLAAGCPQLHTFELTTRNGMGLGWRPWGDSALAPVTASCSLLRSLDLSGFHSMTDAGCAAIAGLSCQNPHKNQKVFEPTATQPGISTPPNHHKTTAP